MNSTAFSPEKAMQIALDQLRLEMPKASFDSWVRDANFVSFEDGIFTVGTPNGYSREWLASRLASTLTRLLTGIMNQRVEVQFVVVEEGGEDEIEKSHENEGPATVDNPAVLSLQAEYQSIYDEIVQPHRVIVVPGYFLRYISLLGVELAWLYIGFRQVAYEAGAARQPGKKFGAPAQKVASYSGMSLRTFRRYSANPETWQRLRDLVTPVEDKPRWQYGNDNHPHRTPRYYRVTMTLPLTPADELSLRAWLYKHLAEGKNPTAVLQAALETSVDELIPWQEDTPSFRDANIELHSVQEVLRTVCGPIPENDRKQFQELADQLSQHLMPPRDLVFLTHYFVTQWLPKLGHGQGWFVVLMRDRCYLNPRTGEIRDEALVKQGYLETANWLGLKRVKTIWEWLRNDEVARFVREISHEIGSWEESPRRFNVCLGEPMIEEDQTRANELLANSGFGVNDTIREKLTDDSIGVADTHNGGTDTISYASDTIRSVMINGFVGAIDTHNGVGDTPIGANGICIGGNDAHKIGADDTFDWRKWHSLNTLALGLNHKKNTSTTTDDCIGSDPEDRFGRHEKGVVGMEWNLSELLSRNRVSTNNQELLLEKGLTVQAFISWLLYSASPAGNGIRDPIAHTISRLISQTDRGAGGAYDELAAISVNELTEILARALSGNDPWNKSWRDAMKGAARDRLLALAYQLGVIVSENGY